MGAVSDLVAERLGGAIDVRQSRQVIQTTAEQVLTNDPERLFWIVVNTGSIRAFVGFDRNIDTQNGLIIGPDGGSLSVTIEDDFVMPVFPLFALIPPGGPVSTNLVIVEVRRESVP